MPASRDIFQQGVDFSALALQSAEFNKHLKPNGQLDFSNPEAVKELTKSLLRRDFGLRVELPNDRLCPPVPNRFNYIIWIQDLLDSTSERYTDQYDPKREVIGLDIGTGSCCIYPLLGCAQRPSWRFAATDIDEKNIKFAKQNVLANDLKAKIRLMQMKADDHLIPFDMLGIERMDFTMCNPPFYPSHASLLESAAAKSRPPNSACTGAEVEMVTPGGEVAFVTRMIEESCILKEKVQWYTSMFGKISSVGTIVDKLKEHGISNWAVTEFVQGGKTKRWAVGWSWGSRRPRTELARGIPNLPKNFLPFPANATFSVQRASLDALAARLNTVLHALDIHWQYRPEFATGIGFAAGNVWSRAARRGKKAKSENGAKSTKPDQDAMDIDDSSEDEEPAFGFKVHVAQKEGRVEVDTRWLQGQDSVLFESLCGMLKRQLAAP